MRNFLTIILGWFLLGNVSAQQEQLTPLSSNPKLYYSTVGIPSDKPELRYQVEKGHIIIRTDTLTLPFVDDFSRNNLRSYKWIENHITDTFYNVTSGCLTYEDINTLSGDFMKDTSWTYSYDIVNKKVDSVANPPYQFTHFGLATTNCFSQVPQTIFYWPPYYTYNFDTLTGFPLDSTLVDDPNINSNRHINKVDYAPVIYFADGERGTLWFDNYAYVNNTFPINPPTIGVATLDGLNEFGEPYNNSNSSTYGIADYLTSKPIDISAFNAGDSLLLSFFYEAQGLGDLPDTKDSLVLEFKDNGGEWRRMWRTDGYSGSAIPPQEFQQVLVRFPDSVRDERGKVVAGNKYFHNVFQFRFLNYASLSGGNDHWHIDYVKLDKNRSVNDTVVHDKAFVYPFPSILKNFTEMPADQFAGKGDLKDSIVLTVRNLEANADTNPPATNFTIGAEELYPTPTVVYPVNVQTFNARSYNFIKLNPSADYTLDTTMVDSLVIVSQVIITPNDSRRENDTLTAVQNMSNLMAYDDGSAEKAYGISGLGLKKFAYAFNLAKPDTLVGFQVMFTQIDRDVADLVFNFAGWNNLRRNDFSFIDTPILSITNKKPLYVDSVNGFATYVLDTPIIISDTFYLGWAQTDERSLQIGYDLNSTLGRQHMFVYLNAKWQQSSLTTEGSPMIRLILDWDFKGGGTGIRDLPGQDGNLVVYPNPTSGEVNLWNGKANARYEIALTNMMGQLVQQETVSGNHFNISALAKGVYLLSAKDISSGVTYHSKIIKTSF